MKAVAECRSPRHEMAGTLLELIQPLGDQPFDRIGERRTAAGECSKVNRPAVHTIYPPVAEGWFAALYAFGGRSGVRAAQVGSLVRTALMARTTPIAISSMPIPAGPSPGRLGSSYRRHGRHRCNAKRNDHK